MPTVGVHDDDASGKKSAGIQKHFRHLVNETASKQRFLRSLHRSSSSAQEGSGSLPPCIKQEPDIKEEELLCVREESGTTAQPDSLDADDQQGSGCGPSEMDSDLAASAGLPDSLGEELGDAACLKADPTSLMQDALRKSDSLSTQPPAVHRQAGSATQQPADKAGAQGLPNGHQEVVQEFLNILGGEVGASTATMYVAAAGGNLAAAINSFYDSTVKQEEIDQQAKSNETSQAASSETSAKSTGLGTHVSVADIGTVNAPQKKASQPPTSKQRGKGRKRVTAPQEANGDGSSKKAKQSMTAQRSIATFFGGRQTPQGNVFQAVKQEDIQQSGQYHANLYTAPADFHQEAAKAEDGVGIHDSPAVSSHQARHVDTIDLVDEEMEVKIEPVNEAAVASEADQSAKLSPVKLEYMKTTESTAGRAQQLLQKQSCLSPHPLHPFFGNHHAHKSANITANSVADGPPPKPIAQGTTSTHPLQLPSNSEKKRIPINPFQKTQVEPDKEVPTDAVLLSTNDYDPIGMAVWQAGQATPYRHISRAFQAMESTTKRLRIGDAIANMFRSILALSPGAPCCPVSYCYQCHMRVLALACIGFRES